MSIRQQRANAIRALSIAGVEKAKSGHPGMPLGMADIAEVLWNDYLNCSPSNPEWANRDRFILSNGHGSMLLYAVLHLVGYHLTVDDLKAFRQLHSKTPGHPEYGETPGVEVTTGPLGQGLANAVGMALAKTKLAALFNQERCEIFDYKIYCFVGDGCLMEGISHEAASFAGTNQLGDLIVFWDDNQISIDGPVEGWFQDNTADRFKAYGWHVIEAVDGHKSDDIIQAIAHAKEDPRPTLICCKTIIGFGSPNKQDTESVHGAPLGAEELAATKKALNWSYPDFEIPQDIKKAWDKRDKGQKLYQEWSEKVKQYQKRFPDLGKVLQHFLQFGADTKETIDSLSLMIKQFQEEKVSIATRKASQSVIGEIHKAIPYFVGGSADLSGSNGTKAEKIKTIKEDSSSGQYIHYGVREFGMAAIMNGLALSGLIPFGGTFLTFADYSKNAIRMSALMKLKVVYIFSHDSIALGEDGPTHQPIEHINMLRMIPGLLVFRPADSVETVAAWQQALQFNGPSCILLTRQTVPVLDRNKESLNFLSKGAYTVFDSTRQTLEKPDAIILATGSEVSLAIEAGEVCQQKGISVRVISVLCAEVFKAQSEVYQKALLPKECTKRLAIEAGNTDYWHQWVGDRGQVMGVNHFGASAPGPVLMEHFGLKVEKIVEKVEVLISEVCETA